MLMSSNYLAFTQVVAVASRSSVQAETFAANHGIPKSYGTYEDLLNDSTVDVVYTGTIADQHFKLACMCLEAGKPTVVEKPMTLSSKQTAALIETAKKHDTFLM